ncbi:MAG: DUF6231 family protein [Ketobacteraceae bacterium]|nr:DUF6231 family protein [Ketobacteraceae bacterium]
MTESKNNASKTSTSRTHKSPAEFLFQWLTENAFEQVGYVGSVPALPGPLQDQVVLKDCNDLQPWHASSGDTALQAVVISDGLADRSQQEVTQLLAGYRNALVGAILVLMDVSGDPVLADNDFYGLGFKKIAEFPHPEHPLAAFEYNLRSYNHKRLWNNPKYWANPENFGKYWW